MSRPWPSPFEGRATRGHLRVTDDSLLDHLQRGLPHVQLHRARHLSGDPGLRLRFDPGVAGAPEIRRQAAGDFGQPRFRTGVPRPYEHAGMAADVPAVAVAVRDLYR